MTFLEYLEAGGLEDGVCRRCGCRCPHRTLCSHCEEDIEMGGTDDVDDDEVEPCESL